MKNEKIWKIWNEIWKISHFFRPQLWVLLSCSQLDCIGFSDFLHSHISSFNLCCSCRNVDSRRTATEGEKKPINHPYLPFRTCWSFYILFRIRKCYWKEPGKWEIFFSLPRSRKDPRENLKMFWKWKLSEFTLKQSDDDWWKNWKFSGILPSRIS